MIVAIAGSILG